MIEGIVGIFVILFLILVVPYIKDWYNRTSSTQEYIDPSIKTIIRDGEIITTDKFEKGDIWFW